MPVGAGFPAQVSLAQCRLKSLLPGFKLRSLVCFPLQAVQNLSLADNFLQELPEDFATAFPALASLDLSRNLFASFPPALAECLWLKDIQLKNNAHLSEDKWLDVIVAKYPSFLTHPPPMLEHIVLDFPAACSHSHTLLVTLAARTIERSTATCIPLANRGLGDAEIRAITPNLVEACRRRQSVGQALNANLRPLASKVKLSLIHRHRLKPGISEGAWCNMCGRIDIDGSNTDGYCCDYQPQDETELINDEGRKVTLIEGGEPAGYYCHHAESRIFGGRVP
mmetsp:Transcript_76445/g.111971  ORF Transcript_76445/g.111971 Transcript_76445/m.111971 type:complete len:281 (+) Transcript_76445:1-843(+)